MLRTVETCAGRHFYQKPFFLLLALFISFFFFNIFRIQTNAQCSPTHRSIADILGYFLYWLIRFIEYLDPTDMHDTPYCFYGGLAYIVMIIGVHIYLELIILNICGIQKTQIVKSNKEAHLNMIQ